MGSRDLGEEEGEPAGEGAEAGAGPTVADGVHVQEEDATVVTLVVARFAIAHQVFVEMTMRSRRW